MPVPMTPEELEDFNNDVHHGFDPYEKRYLDTTEGAFTNFKQLPYCMHFFYMGFNGGMQDFRHYYHDNGNDAIPYGDVPNLIVKLARNAVLKDYNPPKHGIDFLDITWRRRSYVAILMDSPLMSFWPAKALRFLPKNNGSENLSFFDADDVEVDIHSTAGGTVKRTAFFCINHMKRDVAGNDLGPGERRDYSYQMAFRVGTVTEPWEYDPGGTNQGPPELP